MTRITAPLAVALAAFIAIPMLSQPEAAAGDDVAAEARATRAEIKKGLGFVPGFIKDMPDRLLPTAWEAMESLEFNPETALPGKIKEIIVVAVAGQIPCRYCTYAGTALAKAAGATKDEIGEGVGMAALTRQWSTVLNGTGYDYKQFVREIDSAFAYAGSGKHGVHPKKVVTAADAYKDIKATFGSVPKFFKLVPESALPALWKQMKTVELSEDSALSPKHKALVGLAVASQIPCRYCVYSDTKSAKAFGATDQEISEAIGMAASVRFWSTYLNGSMVDEKQFRRDVDRLTRPQKSARR